MREDFGFTQDQIDIQLMTRDFIRKELTFERIKECDEKNEVPMDIVKKCAEMGLTSITLPESIGGGGMGQVTNSLILEEIGYQDVGFATTIGACSLAYEPISLFGTQEQKELYGKYIVEGGLAAFALTEADAGSDVSNARTTAVKEGDEWVINGTKTYITNGANASIYTVFAVTNPGAGTRGMSCFIVERDRPGISVGKEEDKMGIRLSNTCEVIFDNVRVPADHLVGKEGQGFKIAMSTFDITRPAGVGACCCGAMRSCIDKCLEYAATRITFGQPILQNQAIQFMIADMEIRYEASRALAYKVASAIDAGVIDSALASASKTMSSDSLVKISEDAIQIFGGNGYSKEYPIEIIYRNAKISQIFEGTNQVQRMVIIKSLLKASGMM
ncbi:MAG: acyl-CoA dehydrogenase [Clostridiales bacterium]|nr:acyl-CoA dehydrogenase [Clostridiales bacterium]